MLVLAQAGGRRIQLWPWASDSVRRDNTHISLSGRVVASHWAVGLTTRGALIDGALEFDIPMVLTANRRPPRGGPFLPANVDGPTFRVDSKLWLTRGLHSDFVDSILNAAQLGPDRMVTTPAPR